MGNRVYGTQFLTIPKKIFTDYIPDHELDLFTLGWKTLFFPESLSRSQLIQGITNLSVGAVALGMGAAAAGAAITYAKAAGKK